VRHRLAASGRGAQGGVPTVKTVSAARSESIRRTAGHGLVYVRSLMRAATSPRHGGDGEQGKLPSRSGGLPRRRLQVEIVAHGLNDATSRTSQPHTRALGHAEPANVCRALSPPTHEQGDRQTGHLLDDRSSIACTMQFRLRGAGRGSLTDSRARGQSGPHQKV